MNIFIMDTGVDRTHPEFLAADGVTNRVRADLSWSLSDGNGAFATCEIHGTATASNAAGRTVGVAPNATIISVRVLDCTVLLSLPFFTTTVMIAKIVNGDSLFLT